MYGHVRALSSKGSRHLGQRHLELRRHDPARFYSSDEADALGLTGLSFLPFEQVRPQCFDLIKGKRTPSYFKFVFLLSPKNLERTLLSTHSSFTPEDITGMFINLKFQQKKLLLTTGISYRFSPWTRASIRSGIPL